VVHGYLMDTHEDSLAATNESSIYEDCPLPADTKFMAIWSTVQSVDVITEAEWQKMRQKHRKPVVPSEGTWAAHYPQILQQRMAAGG
jgi:hypothetical protein